MAMLINCVCFLAFIASPSSSYGRLNKFIKHFEALDYELEYKQTGAGRRVAKRSTLLKDEVLLPLVFKAFGRMFRLVLRKDTKIFARKAQMEGGYSSSDNLNANTMVAGFIDGDETSSVYGWLTHTGLFIGTIKSKNGTYYMEPAEKYFDKASFHSVIYRSQDIQHSLAFGVNFTEDGSEIGEPVLRVSSNRYSRHRRERRASTKLDASKICRLSLAADYTFLKMAGGTEHAIHAMVTHIQALNEIFSYSFFSTDKPANGNIFALGNDSVVQFQIAKIRVYNESETSRVLARGSLDAATVLRLMQERGGYSKYCLALFFTARSFTEGVLGVAYPGGACSPMNSGVVSFMRQGVMLPTLVTEIAVAHVVGHAFGAKHDPLNDCPRNKNDGGFIMTRFGLIPDKPNNFLYSPCSVRQIKTFIKTIRDKRCLELVSARQSLCGNGVVEDDTDGTAEECDCGDEETCTDLEPGNCCDYKTCRLREHAVCSVSNGFCCDATTCSYKKKGDVCSFETECSDETVCSGSNSTCPQSPHKDDLLECNRNTSICMNGVCSGKSICVKFELEACFCQREMDECKICCFHESICRPAQNITKIKSKLKSIYLSPGSLCANRKGYCDVFHECQPINLNAPFSHRYDPYIRKKGVKEITHQFWWAIFLGTVGLIACVVMLIKYGALYTRSSNPEINELQPARTLPRLKLSRLKEEERGIILTDDIAA